MYEMVIELTYDYSDYSAFVGDAGKIEFEVSGIPGLASSIALACNQWIQINRLYMETFAIYQDTEPFFDKYKVLMVFHESPIAWAVIIPLIPLLIKAIAALGVSFIIWRMATVIFAPPQPILDAETVKAIDPIIDNILKSDLTEEQKTSIINALLKGAEKLEPTDIMKWIAIGAVAIGGIMLISNLIPLIPKNRR